MQQLEHVLFSSFSPPVAMSNTFLGTLWSLNSSLSTPTPLETLLPLVFLWFWLMHLLLFIFVHGKALPCCILGLAIYFLYEHPTCIIRPRRVVPLLQSRRRQAKYFYG